MPDAEYLASLPRTRGAAAALLIDDLGRVLLVKPTYKEGWFLPGGVIEQGESPLAACRRECEEELGFVPALDGIICYDWAPPEGEVDATNVWVFAGSLSQAQIDGIVLPPDELSDHVMATADKIPELAPPHIGRRLRSCLAADGRPLYLEDGLPV
ncbi:MAG: NUDIX hydrolase [Streptosporangiaceae bacterium]